MQLDEYTLSRLELLRNPDKQLAHSRARALALFAALLPLYSRRSLHVRRGSSLETLARQMRMREELLSELLDKFYDHW